MIPEIVNKKFVDFPQLTTVKFPTNVKDITNVEDATLLFRLGNTQFKKALDYFVLDGYVTEYIQMKQDVSKLYKHLSMMETSIPRIFAMQERRKDTLEPITKELNQKAYEVTIIELEVELSDIYSCLFDLKNEELATLLKPKKS